MRGRLGLFNYPHYTGRTGRVCRQAGRQAGVMAWSRAQEGEGEGGVVMVVVGGTAAGRRTDGGWAMVTGLDAVQVPALGLGRGDVITGGPSS